MPINPVPVSSDIAVSKDVLRLPPTWVEFFRGVFYALFGWKRSFTATKTFDFPNIAAGGQSTTTVAVVGARQGDAVLVTPKTSVAGLDCWGIVTANDVVTIVRANFSLGAIDPASDDFRVVVLQQ